MNSSLPNINQLRNDINFASISQFFHTFQSAFRPWPMTTQDIIYSRKLENSEYVFQTEDLERMILDASERIRLEDLIVRMLRLLTHNRFINMPNWQTYLSKEFDKRESEEVNPFIATKEVEEGQVEENIEPVNYFTMPLNTRVYLLYLLCEWHLDEPDKFREHLESEEGSVQWRVDPVGFDKKGSTFWLFDDNRLYKETPKPKATKSHKKKRNNVPSRRSSRRTTRSSTQEKEQSDEEESEEEGEWMPWKLLCYSKADWEQLPLKYVNSKNPDEQNFHRLLSEDLLPKVLPVLEEHEKELKKQEAMLNRKRSSRIMMKELEALETSSVESWKTDEMQGNSSSQSRSRASNRIERKAKEKEEREKEALAKAREQRLLERERRIMEREYRALAREKRQASQEASEDTNNNIQPSISKTTPLQELSTINKSNQPVKASSKVTEKNKENKEQKPKRKYVKRPKFDEHGNLIPPKKRGRKPKNRTEEEWTFNCVCGVSGKNLDDGTPMVACEKCGIWQHISCLQKYGQIGQNANMDNINFICQNCENDDDDIDIEKDDGQKYKRQKTDSHSVTSMPTVAMNYQSQNINVDPRIPSMQTSWQFQYQPSVIRENSLPRAPHHSSPSGALALPPINNLANLKPRQQNTIYSTPVPNINNPFPTHNQSLSYQPKKIFTSNDYSTSTEQSSFIRPQPSLNTVNMPLNYATQPSRRDILQNNSNSVTNHAIEERSPNATTMAITEPQNTEKQTSEINNHLNSSVSMQSIPTAIPSDAYIQSTTTRPHQTSISSLISQPTTSTSLQNITNPTIDNNPQ
ncbi:MAG: hypothetical protein EXX96DRAFT_574805 [Benjaminiella poitrasii]|nr:MAG: hypothetical protein EXX96DRAFT_574805 [Benjaminiella poitrasii]